MRALYTERLAGRRATEADSSRTKLAISAFQLVLNGVWIAVVEQFLSNCLSLYLKPTGPITTKHEVAGSPYACKTIHWQREVSISDRSSRLDVFVSRENTCQ